MNSQELTESYVEYNHALGISKDRKTALEKNQAIYENAFERYMATTGQKRDEHLAEMENLKMQAGDISWNFQLNNPEEIT